MNRHLKIGAIELHWLNGGLFELDGGAMFGVVPKVMWGRRYPSDSDNFIPLRACPILIKTPGSLVLLETGLGNKFTEKQNKIFRVREDWNILNDLNEMGIGRDEIRHVVLTHYDFDHSGGVVMKDSNGGLALSFPNARHIIQKKEWEDVLNPNRRSINTYWPINYEILRDSNNLDLIEGDAEITEGVRVVHTGGHNRGHQIAIIESGNEKAVHMADLLPTHAHYNPLWIMAYDNFPLDSIFIKEELEEKALRENAWLTFYHDATVLAGKFDRDGNLIEKIVY